MQFTVHELVFLLLLLNVYLFYGYFVCKFVCVPLICLLTVKARKGTRLLETGITADGCLLPCGIWESKLGPVEEQPLFLTTEQSTQHHEVACL